MTHDTLLADAEAFARDRAEHHPDATRREGFTGAAAFLMRRRNGGQVRAYEVTGDEPAEDLYPPGTAAALDDVIGYLVDAGRPGHEDLVAELQAIVDRDTAGGATEITW